MKYVVTVLTTAFVLGIIVSPPTSGSPNYPDNTGGVIRAIEEQTRILKDIERLERDQLDVLKSIQRAATRL